ncbi:MAG: biotin/lipoyl-containing protein [Acidobacteriota bacterium]
MGMVELVEYVVKEKEKVEKGQTIAIVENWWAKMALKAVGPGYLSKTFFERGTQIKEGDPLAIVVCDPEDGPRSKETSELEVIETIRNKPSGSRAL